MFLLLLLYRVLGSNTSADHSPHRDCCRRVESLIQTDIDGNWRNMDSSADRKKRSMEAIQATGLDLSYMWSGWLTSAEHASWDY